jgi:positive regulator of sigma E activity
LLAMIGGALLGGWVAASLSMGVNGAELVGGVAGLALGLLWLRRFGQSHGKNPHYRPVILRRAAPAPARVELDLPSVERT